MFLIHFFYLFISFYFFQERIEFDLILTLSIFFIIGSYLSFDLLLHLFLGRKYEAEIIKIKSNRYGSDTNSLYSYKVSFINNKNVKKECFSRCSSSRIAFFEKKLKTNDNIFISSIDNSKKCNVILYKDFYTIIYFSIASFITSFYYLFY